MIKVVFSMKFVFLKYEIGWYSTLKVLPNYHQTIFVRKYILVYFLFYLLVYQPMAGLKMRRFTVFCLILH